MKAKKMFDGTTVSTEGCNFAPMGGAETGFFGDTKIGLLGAGQLGLMLAQAAADLCLDVQALDADPAAPAARYLPTMQADYAQEIDVLAFGADKDLLTIEIEHVSLPALHALERAGKKVYPQPHVLETIADKLIQKRFYIANGIPTAPYIEVAGKADVAAALHALPAYQKAARGGYDGKGVVFLAGPQDIGKAFDVHGYLEQPANALAELCVIVARSTTGEVVAYPAVESVYHPQANMVDYLLCPARVPAEVEAAAQALALRTAEAFGVVGLLAVEMFYTQNGELWVNECAPRPHNTGHHTIEACPTSQYAQHWRAILGMPLGATALRCPAAMVNLVGAPGHTGPAIYAGLEDVLRLPWAHVHLYGKAETRPFRKMGHVTILAEDSTDLPARVATVKGAIRVTARK